MQEKRTTTDQPIHTFMNMQARKKSKGKPNRKKEVHSAVAVLPQDKPLTAAATAHPTRYLSEAFPPIITPLFCVDRSSCALVFWDLTSPLLLLSRPYATKKAHTPGRSTRKDQCTPPRSQPTCNERYQQDYLPARLMHPLNDSTHALLCLRYSRPWSRPDKRVTNRSQKVKTDLVFHLV